MTTTVVYVHGLWLPGHEGFLLRRRLGQRLDAETRAFSYASVGATLTENASALARYLTALRADTVHLVAHSMGGAVVLKLFEMPVTWPTGRIVFLGSPVRGSATAARLARWPKGRVLLGATARQVLLGTHSPQWSGVCDLGVIAGTRALGGGRLLGRMPGPNDGTVWVHETDLPGAIQQIRLNVSHSALPFAPSVAERTAAFLATGRFEPSVSRRAV